MRRVITPRDIAFDCGDHVLSCSEFLAAWFQPPVVSSRHAGARAECCCKSAMFHQRVQGEAGLRLRPLLTQLGNEMMFEV
eukprot:11987338-Alexandrium_andersonii.AAC.1